MAVTKKVAKKRVAKKKAVASTRDAERLAKLKSQVDDLKAENRTLKAEGRHKDRQIAALLKALGTMEKRISRFVATEQKNLLKQYELTLKPKRRRRRRVVEKPPAGQNSGTE